MTYEERLKEIATEMAIENFKRTVTGFYENSTWESLDDYGKDVEIDSFYESARIALKHMAEQHEIGYREGFRRGHSEELVNRAEELVKKGLWSINQLEIAMDQPMLVQSNIPTEEDGKNEGN